LYTNIEPKAEINDLETCNDGSGMFFVPQEQEKIGTYFLPSIGPAPKWCTFLEQLTEELEESKSTSLYEDFKFLTALDLEKLNATHLIGTPALKAYMHGYFMELKAYQKLYSVVDPFAYDRYKKAKIQEKLEQQAEKRINIQRKQAKVNIDYVKELEEKKASKAKKGQAAGGKAEEGSVLKDSRFDTLFTDPAFAIDRNSEHYQQIKTTMPSKLEQASDDEGGEGQEASADSEDGEADAKNTARYQPRNLNNLFADKDDSGDDSSKASGGDDLEDETFGKKLSKDQKKKQKRLARKDRIIKNYGAVGENQRMRELGEKLLSQKASEKSK